MILKVTSTQKSQNLNCFHFHNFDYIKKKKKIYRMFHKFPYGPAIVNSSRPITSWKGFSSCHNCLWKYQTFTVLLNTILHNHYTSFKDPERNKNRSFCFSGFIVFYVLTDMRIVRNLNQKTNKNKVKFNPRRANVHNMRTVNFHTRVYLILLQPLFWVWLHQEWHLHWCLPFTR